ncbi:MAG: LysE family translocator [Gammaproteobacteria bacterium]|jgi:threonine/homoserine/homoserine lactone efflux protein|nr:LysE family translocator [Gammaproteobacteria bacterium]
MTLSEALTLFATLAALAAVPSASVALVIARAITLGVGHGIAVGAGIVLGDLVFIALVMLGLSVIAEAMGGAFLLVKYAGAGYLVWLGVTLLRAAGSDAAPARQTPRRGSVFASLAAGFLLTLGDIKAIFFYLSLLPLFIDLTALRAADVALIVVITVAAVGGVKVLYAVFAHRVLAGAWGKRYARLSGKAAGVALVGAGGYLIVKA